MLLDAEALRSSLVEIWEKVWVKCEVMGAVMVRYVGILRMRAPFMQGSLIAFVDVASVCGVSGGMAINIAMSLYAYDDLEG